MISTLMRFFRSRIWSRALMTAFFSSPSFVVVILLQSRAYRGSRTRTISQLLLSSALRLRQLPHHLVKVKARWFLSDWIFLKTFKPRANHGMRRHDYKPAGSEVAPVVGSRLGSALKRVSAQVVEIWNAKAFESLPPDIETRMVLLDERDLPGAE